MAICRVNDCVSNVWVMSSGLCSAHYNRLRTTGTTDDGPQAKGTLKERFWRQVDKRDPDECWEWAAKSKVDGYGVIGRGGRYGKKVLAHRLSWELHNGDIPETNGYHGTVVMHKCDNRLCVNPNHLMLGTQGDNVKDMDDKGRRKTTATCGSKHHMTTITEEEAAQIYQMEGLYRIIAEHYNCTLAVVKSIKRRITWKQQTENLTRG